MVGFAETELATEARVLRLARHIPRFIPTGQPPLNGEAFAPSGKDEDEANRRRLPVRVSVWDLSGISADQASVFRNLPGERLWTLVLSVGQIARVAAAFEMSRIRVVSDPIESAQLGANAHCGIEGLDRRPGENKQRMKAVRDELARLAATSFVVGRAA